MILSFSVTDNILCPQCKETGKIVPIKTLATFVKETIKRDSIFLDDFYFCKTGDCKVVYFSKDRLLTQKDINTEVGLKDNIFPSVICYCFGWTKEKISEEIDIYGKTNAIEDIKTKMSKVSCNCIMLNPSGNCCLNDIGKVILELEQEKSKSI